MEGGLNFTVFSCIHDETIGYSNKKKEFYGVPKAFIDLLVIYFWSNIGRKSFDIEKVAQLMVVSPM